MSPISPQGVSQPRSIAPAGSPEAINKVRARTDFGKMPLYFVENRGQVDPHVAYYVQGRETALYFTREGVTFRLTDRKGRRNMAKAGFLKAGFQRPNIERAEEASRWAVKLDFVGANPSVRISSEDKTSALVSYFKGPREKWKTGLSTHGSIRYADLWPGIDLVYSGTTNRLKYTFVVEPGADPAKIRLAYRGAQVRLNERSQLEVSTPAGTFRDDSPRAYQEIGGQRVDIAAAYALEPDEVRDRRTYGFEVGSYDASRPLVIDPAVFVYSGYIGGSGGDQAFAIALDGAGNAYVTGYTDSTEATFPVAVGPDLTHNQGFEDAFVAKVRADGTGLVYAGYIGGSGSDYATGIAVDGSGNAYVTGYTNSTEATFPLFVGPVLTYGGAQFDAFVARVNAAGTMLDYAGYIGGAGDDRAGGIAADAAGNAYVTGFTSSHETTFPTAVGPGLVYNGGTYDAFVAKIKADGTGFTFVGYIGGSGIDFGSGIAVDALGHAYVTGNTNSTETTFPVTVGPGLTASGGGDAFVAKVKVDGTGLDYAGFIGGNNLDAGTGIAVDGSGSAYVTGYTHSTHCTFPVLIGPDLLFNGGGDAFVAKIKPDGTGLLYAGYIGGSGFDSGAGLAVDSAGNAYVTGSTTSTAATFPVVSGPQLTHNGGADAFVAKVKAAGTGLDYCGYIGGSAQDIGTGIAVDGSGHAYIAGYTSSSETTFRVTTGPDLTFHGVYDAFVAKIDEHGIPTPTPIPSVTRTFTPSPFGQSTVTSTRTGTPTRTMPPTAACATGTPTPTPPSPPATNTPTSTGLTALSPASVWIGLKNSDDVGIRFDLLAQVFKNGVLIGSGQANGVGGGSSGFVNSKLGTIPLTLFSPVDFPSRTTLAFSLSVRNACAGSGKNSGTARLWYNGKPVDGGTARDAGSRFDATIGGTDKDYYLRSDFSLNTAFGASKVSIDRAVGGKCGPFVSLGTWSIMAP